MCPVCQSNVSGREGLLRPAAIQDIELLNLNIKLRLNLRLGLTINVRNLTSVLQTDIMASVLSFCDLVVADCSVYDDSS